MSEGTYVNIVGAGLSGLSAAITLAKSGVRSRLISTLPSERAQSVMAEGGINAALDTMGEHDTVEEHFADTMRGGVYLESESAVRGLTESAPEIVRELSRLGVPFNSANGKLTLRNFGGQSKKRTAYAKSSTGKMNMTALIDEVRKYEVAGLVKRYPHHELIEIKLEQDIHGLKETGKDNKKEYKSEDKLDNKSEIIDKIKKERKRISSISVRDTYTDEVISFYGVTILCTGGLNGLFEGMTTGTTANTGDAAALAFSAGVEFANLEFIQYHPTTVQIANKRMLISEAARGEGGRLYAIKDGKPWYFMEEEYPELGNLMPRDVVSREMSLILQDSECEGEIYLDMTGIDKDIFESRLSDLRSEIIDYIHIDPMKEPVPVSPGIHFFMGGIRVNDRHETSVKGLYAAGEAACKYHGANRLGGNSMLGAIYGGRVAAESVLALIEKGAKSSNIENAKGENNNKKIINIEKSPAQEKRLKELLSKGLGVIRTLESMTEAERELSELVESDSEDISPIDLARAKLGLAMLRSAVERRESRGAHYRTDYPESDDKYKSQTVARYADGEIYIEFASAESGFGGDGV